MKRKAIKNFTITESNHLIIECKVNNIITRLLIDTGASNSCINYLSANKFKITFKKHEEKASSATNHIKEIFYSNNNILEIENLKKNNFEVILFDMTHINNSLREKEIKDVDGIIGGDILKEFNVIINYKKKIIILNF